MESMETEWTPGKEMRAFRGTGGFLFVVNSRESHKIYHVIKFVPRVQKVLYGQYGGGFLFLKRSILKRASHWTLEYPVHSVQCKGFIRAQKYGYGRDLK